MERAADATALALAGGDGALAVLAVGVFVALVASDRIPRPWRVLAALSGAVLLGWSMVTGDVLGRFCGAVLAVGAGT